MSKHIATIRYYRGQLPKGARQLSIFDDTTHYMDPQFTAVSDKGDFYKFATIRQLWEKYGTPMWVNDLCPDGTEFHFLFHYS